MKHGGNLSVSVRPDQSGGQATSRGIEVIVADSGDGMDSHVRAKLFEPFFTTKGDTGTGLGLWVSKGIVDKHHGDISLHSKPGEGTEVSVFLPFDGLKP